MGRGDFRGKRVILVRDCFIQCVGKWLGDIRTPKLKMPRYQGLIDDGSSNMPRNTTRVNRRKCVKSHGAETKNNLNSVVVYIDQFYIT